jgi:hypothetical protein
VKKKVSKKKTAPKEKSLEKPLSETSVIAPEKIDKSLDTGS